MFMFMTKTIWTKKNSFRYQKLMSPLNAAICTTISYTLWVEWYYLKNNYFTLRSKSHEGHYVVICTTISYTLWVEWYYLKNNYLTSRSKVKVPRRLLWYVTHRLMVMHPHTKYNGPIWKGKQVLVRTSFAEKEQKKWKRKKKKWKRKKKIRLKQYVSLRLKGRHN